MLPSKTILHPTDFSADSNLAFALACSLARSSGSRLLVLHVMPVPLFDAKRHYLEEVEEAERRRQVERCPVAVERRLEEGEAAPEILRVAQERRCDLIVMGTRGRTRLSRLLVGSVAEQVMRHAPCPVLTVKAPAGATATAGHGSEVRNQVPTAVPLRTILHPTDFSDPSEEAFRVACRLAEGHSARVILVHVAEPATPGIGMAAGPPPPEGHLGGLEGRLCRFQLSAPRVQVECRVEVGNAAAGIADAARTTACDLIVMGTHGRTGLRRVLMGSVAEKVLRTAVCPVMTVKLPPPGAAPLLEATPEVGHSRR